MADLKDRVAEVQGLYEGHELWYGLLYDREGRLPLVHHQVPGAGEAAVQTTQASSQHLQHGQGEQASLEGQTLAWDGHVLTSSLKLPLSNWQCLAEPVELVINNSFGHPSQMLLLFFHKQ